MGSLRVNTPHTHTQNNELPVCILLELTQSVIFFGLPFSLLSSVIPVNVLTLLAGQLIYLLSTAPLLCSTTQ